MNKIEKFLAKLDYQNKVSILELMYKVRAGDVVGLNIKKLEGSNNTFRLKKGCFRIVYTKKDGDIEIVSVNRRSEKTYRDF